MLLNGNRKSFSPLFVALGASAAGLALLLATAAQGKGPDRLGARGDWDAMPCRMQHISNPVNGGELGWDVSIDGDVAVAYSAGYSAGNHLVYVYRFDGVEWQHEAILPIPQDHVLSCAKVDGDVIVVGDYHNDDMGNSAGAAYICRYDGSDWVSEATLYASDPEPNDQFGQDVDVDGDVVVIGARRYMVPPDGEGSTYVFRHIDDDWIEEAELIPSDGADGDHFGSAVAVENDTIIVTVKENDALYYFHRTGGTWEERQIIEVPESPSYIDPTFIDLSGDRVIAGRPRDDDLGTFSGSAYVYERVDGAWSLRQKLLASHGGEYDCFGRSVAISGETAFVGAAGYDVEGLSAWAYVFRLVGETWEEVVRLEGDWDYRSMDGRFLALDGDRGIVSAVWEGYWGDPQGAIYLYAGMTGVDCNNNGTADGCDIFLGTSEDMNDNGIPDECECPADFDGDGDVDTADLLFLLGAWGTPDGDVDFDGDTDTSDLLALLAAWGECPE